MKSQAAILHELATDADDLTDTDTITIEEIDVREPTGEEVLVEVTAGSLCHTDLKMVRGTYENPMPLVMGHEGTGTVRATGDEVTSVEPGDDVVFGRIACGKCEFCRRGRSNLCTTRGQARNAGTMRTGERGFSLDGHPINHTHGVSSFSEYTLVTDDVAVKIPDGIPPEQATLLGCGVFTGFGAVMNSVDVPAGASVAIFGTGGVGLSGVQGARLGNATTIVAVDLVPEKLELAEELGATRTVNPDEDDVVDRITDITDGGVDFAFDMVGNPAVLEQAIEVLGPTGTAVIVGTPGTGTFPLDVNVQDLLLTEKRIVGSFNGSYNLADAIPVIAELVLAEKVSVEALIADTKPMTEVRSGLSELEAGGSLRQVLLP